MSSPHPPPPFLPNRQGARPVSFRCFVVRAKSVAGSDRTVSYRVVWVMRRQMSACARLSFIVLVIFRVWARFDLGCSTCCGLKLRFTT